MIIADIFGGLGNQMFQYATAYQLASHLNTELILNTHALKQDSRRVFALKPFWVSNKIIQYDMQEASALKNFLHGIPNSTKRYKEVEEFVYDPLLLSLKGDYHISGYWQNPTYFENSREPLLSLFSLRTLSSEFTATLLLIRELPSLSLHVRRGDFVENPEIKSLHDVCSLEYYKNAIEQFRQLFGSDQHSLFVFSDDPYWCRKHFAHYSNLHFVQSLTDTEELILMSECLHNITANGTFRWWGAWLNKNPNKIVITPNTWLKNSSLKYQNILPETWVKLEVTK